MGVRDRHLIRLRIYPLPIERKIVDAAVDAFPPTDSSPADCPSSDDAGGVAAHDPAPWRREQSGESLVLADDRLQIQLRTRVPRAGWPVGSTGRPRTAVRSECDGRDRPGVAGKDGDQAAGLVGRRAPDPR